LGKTPLLALYHLLLVFQTFLVILLLLLGRLRPVLGPVLKQHLWVNLQLRQMRQHLVRLSLGFLELVRLQVAEQVLLALLEPLLVRPVRLIPA